MASLPPPTITPFSSTFPWQSQLHLYDHLKPTNFLINGKCKKIVLIHRVSCNDSNRDRNTTTLMDAQIRENSPKNLYRRNLLVGLGLIGSLDGSAMNTSSNDPLALAASIVTPDTSKSIVAEMLLITTSSHDFPVRLDKVVRVWVKRPKRSRTKKEKEEEEEVLVVDGIEFDSNEYVKFNVLVNEEDEGASGPDKTEFAGSFSNVPQIKSKKNGKKTIRTCLRLGIGELLEDLEAEGDESLLVTLVPRAGIGLLSIGGVKIELE